MDVFDFLRTPNGDLKIDNGDFVIGESTAQHQNDILLAQKGEYKQFPMLGVAILDFILGDSGVDEFKQVVRAQFEADGMKVKSIKTDSSGNFDIDASYGNPNNVR